MLPKHKRSPERAQFLSDIILTAVEGGINYWGAVSGYRWWSPTLKGGSAEHPDGLANAYVTIYRVEEGDTTGTTIGVDDIARALGILAARPVKGLSESSRRAINANDRVNGDIESGPDIDADLADVIVQVALFEEVVYG